LRHTQNWKNLAQQVNWSVLALARVCGVYASDVAAVKTIEGQRMVKTLAGDARSRPSSEIACNPKPPDDTRTGQLAGG
jgi:hypothetical protein